MDFVGNQQPPPLASIAPEGEAESVTIKILKVLMVGANGFEPLTPAV